MSTRPQKIQKVTDQPSTSAPAAGVAANDAGFTEATSFFGGCCTALGPSFTTFSKQQLLLRSGGMATAAS